MLNRRKKILVVGGVSRSLVNFRGPLIKALVNQGLEVHAAASDLKRDTFTSSKLHSWGVYTHDVPIKRNGLSPTSDLIGLWSLYRLCRKIQPDLLFGYTIKPVIYGTLAARIAGVQARYPLITGLGYAFTGEATGKRYVVQYIARSLYRIALTQATKVFFQNPDDEAQFRKLNLVPDAIPTAIINGSGVDTSQYRPAPLPHNPVSFLLIARLLGDKGVREYIEAARTVKTRYPETRFVLVGDLDSNPDSISQDELDEWIHSGIIEYPGRLEDVRPAIAEASVYVLPSYREGTPRTVLEAMAMGRPIITTDAPGCRETVIDGDNGYLVPVQDSEALSAAMARFIGSSSLIHSMGARSRSIAEEKYDVRKVNRVLMTGMDIVE